MEQCYRAFPNSLAFLLGEANHTITNVTLTVKQPGKPTSFIRTVSFPRIADPRDSISFSEVPCFRPLTAFAKLSCYPCVLFCTHHIPTIRYYSYALAYQRRVVCHH